jgi:hypothetical protein
VVFKAGSIKLKAEREKLITPQLLPFTFKLSPIFLSLPQQQNIS